MYINKPKDILPDPSLRDAARSLLLRSGTASSGQRAARSLSSAGVRGLTNVIRN